MSVSEQSLQNVQGLQQVQQNAVFVLFFRLYLHSFYVVCWPLSHLTHFKFMLL